MPSYYVNKTIQQDLKSNNPSLNEATCHISHQDKCIANIPGEIHRVREKNGSPKQNAVKCTVYNTIQCHLHSIIYHSFRHCV